MKRVLITLLSHSHFGVRYLIIASGLPAVYTRYGTSTRNIYKEAIQIANAMLKVQPHL